MAKREMRRGVGLCVAGAGLIAVSVLVTNNALGTVCSVSDHWFLTRDGTRIHSRLYTPLPPPSAPVPGVLVAHGYMANLAMVELPLVRLLVRRGFVVLSLDRHGHGRSGGRLWPPPPPPRIRLQDFDPELQAGVQFLRRQSLVNPTDIGLVGHSDGSRAVIMTACADWSIASTVAISGTLHPLDWMNDIVPKNLLLLYGTDERFVPTGDEELLFKRVTDGHPLQPGELVGSLSSGDARRLAVIPGAGHVTALFNSATVQETTQWLQQSFPATTFREDDFCEQSPPYLWLVVGLCGAALVLIGIVAALPASPTRTEPLALCSIGTSVRLGVWWLTYRTILFGLAIAAAARIAQVLDPALAWVPLDGAHWFVALPWGIFIGACAVTPVALVTRAHWQDARTRIRRLHWRHCPGTIALGALLGLAEMAAISIALMDWYEGYPASAKLIALGILFPSLLAPMVGIEIWLRVVLPAELSLTSRVERAGVVLVLGLALCVFLNVDLPPWPGIVYVPYYLTAVELGAGTLLFASWPLRARPFAAASALAFIAAWVAAAVCPLY